MALDLTTVAISGMLGALVGSLVQKIIGGKRSSVGIHRRSGKIMPFWMAAIFFPLVTLTTGIFTAILSDMITTAIPGLQATIITLVAVSIFLAITSYAR